MVHRDNSSCPALKKVSQREDRRAESLNRACVQKAGRLKASSHNTLSVSLNSVSHVNPLDQKQQQQESPPKYSEGEEAVRLLPVIAFPRVVLRVR